MSVESTVVFYGVRFDITDNEVVSLEDRSDVRLSMAKKNGLKWYWGNFASPEKLYYLFIGDEIAIAGFEKDRDIQLPSDVLVDRMRQTQEKLQKAGLSQPPMLYIQWQPDA